MSQFKLVSKELIDRGWSGDKKYCVTTDDGTRYLLRVTPEAKSMNRADMFRMQKEVAALGVPMCRPIEFGKCDEGVYTIQTWIDGDDAEKVVPHLADSQQYALGLEAGKILKKIHTIPAPENQKDWEPRFNQKTDWKIMKYNECPIKYEGGGAFIEYIT